MLSAFLLMPLRRPACDRHIFLPANNSVQRSQQLHFLFAATFFLLFLKIFFCLTGMMELLPKKFLRFINFLLFLTRPQDASFFACCAAILPESHIIPDIPVWDSGNTLLRTGENMMPCHEKRSVICRQHVASLTPAEKTQTATPP